MAEDPDDPDHWLLPPTRRGSFRHGRLRAVVERNKARRRWDGEPPAAAPAPVEPRGGGGGWLGGAAAAVPEDTDS